MNLAKSMALYSSFTLATLTAFKMAPVNAALIFNNTHQYAFGGDPQAIIVDVDVFDNYLGDFNKYLWQYTVTNNSYDPNPGTSNGFSGFETALPLAVSDLDDAFAPSSEWEVNCCSGQPVEWDIRNSDGLGVMPGETGVFGFTSLPRLITNSTGWFHTWESNIQTNLVFYPPGDGPEVPNVFLPPISRVPEPSIIFGLILISGIGVLVEKCKTENN